MATDSIPGHATHEDIGRLEGHIQATREGLSRMEGNFQAIRKDVSRMEGTVDATRKDVSRLDGKLDRLDNRLWLFMGTILVFTLGIVAKEVL